MEDVNSTGMTQVTGWKFALLGSFGIAAYLLFLATFLYLIGFVGNIGLVKSIDQGSMVSWEHALAVDVFLLGLFALQHSGMARRKFKRVWTRVVPPSIERSCYVFCANLALILLFWQWRPMGTVVWSVDDPVARIVIQTVFWSGWIVILVSTFLIDHFSLFGLRQSLGRISSGSEANPFRTPLFYRFSRHPMYLGFLLSFWAAPVMTAGHLVFSLAMSGYLLLGISLEERDLLTEFGEVYRRYRERVGMLLPGLGKKQ